MKPSVQAFLVQDTITIKQAMRMLSQLGEKQLFVIDGGGKLLGALSDGDIRKWILKEGNLEESVRSIYNHNPKFVFDNYRMDDVKQMMLDLRIECIPVVVADRQVIDVLVWDDVFAGHVHKHHPALDVSVVIMAGGKGTRLDPFTRVLPKPLIPVGDRPVIEIIMDKFAEYGVKNFYISLYHKARMVKSYFEEADPRYRIKFLEEKKPLGTIGGLTLAKGMLKGTFILTNCDVIIDSDYTEIIHFHKNAGYDLTLVVCMRHYQIPYGVCELESGGTLKLIKEKPEYDLLVNTGFYVMNEKVLDVIPADESSTILDLIAAIKLKSGRVGVFPVNEKSWIDVGQWEEYYKSIKDLQQKII